MVKRMSSVKGRVPEPCPPQRMPDEARCVRCGYLLRGLPDPVCPECGHPFDPRDATTYKLNDGGRRAFRTPQLWLALFVLVGIVLLVPSLMCMCGYFDGVGLLIIGSLALLTWGCFLTNKCENVPLRFFLAALTVAVSLILIKSVVDVLWLGHDAVFG